MDRMKIGPLEYRIVETPKLMSEDGERSLFGEAAYQAQELRLEADMSPIRKRIVLWHEALHAIAEVRGIELTEEMIGALGTALYELVADNPWLGENPSPGPSPGKGGGPEGEGVKDDAG